MRESGGQVPQDPNNSSPNAGLELGPVPVEESG